MCLLSCVHAVHTVYPKKYADGFCFAVLCCCYTLTDFPISIRLTSLALWQSNDSPSASKATLMNMDKYFMWIHYERLHNHNKAKHNKTVCIFLGIYCSTEPACNKDDCMHSWDNDCICVISIDVKVWSDLLSNELEKNKNQPFQHKQHNVLLKLGCCHTCWCPGFLCHCAISS